MSDTKIWTVSYTAFFKASPDDINQRKERVANLQNALGRGKSGTVNAIFEAGLTALETEHADDAALDSVVV